MVRAGPYFGQRGGRGVRKIWFGEAECRGNTVRYYLLAEEWKELGESYGLQVRYGEESAMIPDITISQRHIERLLQALVRGGVTPVTAREVVDDWLNS